MTVDDFVVHKFGYATRCSLMGNVKVAHDVNEC